jgi:tRNA 2-thiouridine synthesizing protein A
MTTNVIDTRGLACPEPVMRTRRAISDTGASSLAVLVSEQVSAENIERMARTLGWTVARHPDGDDIRLTLTKGAAANTG